MKSKKGAKPSHEPESGPVFAGKSGPSETTKVVGEVLTSLFEGLPPRQSQAVEALLREPTVSRAAIQCGVHERTLRKWLATTPFKSAVLQARREAFGQAVGLSQRYAPVAVATLVKLMQDATVTPAARVTAAVMLLRFGRDGIELDDLIARLEALERTAWNGSPASTGINDKVKELE